MKKKGPRAIPDFSRKPKRAPSAAAPADQKPQPVPHPSAAVSKPQGPPLKSGRRGS
jgi:hypothetical protein